jgi:hypothetical protein
MAASIAAYAGLRAQAIGGAHSAAAPAPTGGVRTARCERQVRQTAHAGGFFDATHHIVLASVAEHAWQHSSAVVVVERSVVDPSGYASLVPLVHWAAAASGAASSAATNSSLTHQPGRLRIMLIAVWHTCVQVHQGGQGTSMATGRPR